MQRFQQQIFLALTGLTLSFLPLMAQGGSDSEDIKKMRQKGASHIEAGEWADAIEVYQRLTKSLPQDKPAWFHLGLAQHFSKLYNDAASSYKTVLAITGLHPFNSVTMYNLGCIHALTGNSDSAFVWLNKSVAAGFSETAQFTSDGDLTSLRADTRFANLIEAVEKNAHPCRYKEGADDLDFWIGDWNVYTPTGQLAGQNLVTVIHDECVIHESWNDAAGLHGTSYNFYDNAVGKWRQTWVDDKGGSALYIGEIVDGAMVYEQSKTDNEGNVILSQMVLTPQEDGTVTQEGRSSTDEGKSWTTNWSLVYHQKDSGKNDHNAHGSEG